TSSFTSRSGTRNMRTSSRRSPVSGSTASGRRLRWKQNILPCTRYDGRPSSETSFVACGRESASSLRSAIVATAMILAGRRSLIGTKHRDAEVSDGKDAAAGGNAQGLFPVRKRRGSALLDDSRAVLRGLAG